MEVMWIVKFFYFIVFFAILLFKYFTRNHDYFLIRKIPHGVPKLLFGTSYDLIKKKVSIFDHILSWYNKFPGHKIVGLFEFSNPFYLIRDPALAKELCVRQFEFFTDNKTVVDEKIDPLMGNTLMSLKGERWKEMRSILSAAFTGSKMRTMFNLVNKSVESAIITIDRDVAVQSSSELADVKEMKRFFSFFTVDVISTCAFGLEVNSFDDQYNVMQMMAKNLMEQKSLVKILKLIGIRLFPSLMKIFGIKILPKSIEKFFKETIIDAFESRRMNHITRPDMIDILLKIEIGEDIVNENGEKVQKKWSQDEIISQCLTFYFAGFRTTSTALSFAAYELALNPDIQDKLRAEVNKVNDITYENLQRIEFLDRVVKETLRKWPPAPAIERNCVKDFSFEYNNHQLIIEKGLNIMIPIFAYHRDENYFKNPEKFDPDREINSEVFMTFGLGQRTCIGSRFALMTIKLILCKMLRKFEFHVTKETQIPLKFKNGISIESEQGIWLKLRKIK